MTEKRQESAFTLIELLIVVAVILVIATMAVPNLISSKLTANESAAVSTMRTIATAEFRFKAMQVLDEDRSGSYEYGSLQELAGELPVRGTGEVIRPTLLSSAFGTLDNNGYAARQGYLYALYLPDSSGMGVTAHGAGLGNVDPGFAENNWTLLAWPSAYGNSGRAAYFVNQAGQLLRCTQAQYGGVNNAPPAGAALVGTGNAQMIVGGNLALGQVGEDGYSWLTVQ